MSADGMAGTTAGHNSAARAATIKDIKYKLDNVNSRIAELMEERKRTKGRIKSDLGMKVADWNVMTRFADLEQDQRDVLFDTIREGFSALGLGEQSSFLTVLGDKPAPEPDKPTKGLLPTIEECATLGAAAFRLGEQPDAFPETVKTKASRESFVAGWTAAKAEKDAAQRAADDEEFGDHEPDPAADEGEEAEEE